MKEIAPRVYVETRYASGNVGFIRTGTGVACVDVPMMPDDGRHWLACIRRVTDGPILFLVQTDYDRERIVSTRDRRRHISLSLRQVEPAGPFSAIVSFWKRALDPVSK